MENYGEVERGTGVVDFRDGEDSDERLLTIWDMFLSRGNKRKCSTKLVGRDSQGTGLIFRRQQCDSSWSG